MAKTRKPRRGRSRKSKSLPEAGKRASRSKQVRTAAQKNRRPPLAKAKGRKPRKAQRLRARKPKTWRRVLIYSDGIERKIKVSLRTASIVGRYMSAVGWLINHNDPSRLGDFAGKSIMDVNRKRYPLETRPNVLYRLSQSGTPSFEDVYRVVAR